MSSTKEKLKETWQKKSILDLESMISEQKRKISLEKDLTALSHLSTELSAMQELHDQKMASSGRLAQKGHKTNAKPDLKSFDDYVKSKK